MKRFFKALKSSVLLVITLATLLSFASCRRDEDAEYEEKLSVLLHDNQRLNNEKEKILLSIEKEFAVPSYMSLLFVDLDPAIYTEAFPIMSKQSVDDVAIVGVLALSEDELPGLDGKLTLSEYNALTDAGWGSALYWNGEKELDSFITDMELLLDGIGIDLPDSVVFAYGTYSSECDATLLSHGIGNAVHSGEENLTYVEGSDPDGVWHPGRIGWRCIGSSTNSSTQLKNDVEANGGYALFELGFDNSAEKYETSFFPVAGNEQDADRVDKFRKMIASFKQSVIKGRIAVDTVGNVREVFDSCYEARARAEEESQLRLLQIEQELEDIRHRMTELYNQYH